MIQFRGYKDMMARETHPFDDAIDLVFVCTPAAANPDLLRACAAKGITAAFLTSARSRRSKGG